MNRFILFFIFYCVKMAQSSQICLPWHYPGIKAIRCVNVTLWTNEPEEFQMNGKNFSISNYAPKQIWLNEKQEIIGMSSATRTLFMLETNLTQDVLPTSMNRLLNGDIAQIPEEKRIWKKTIPLSERDPMLIEMEKEEQQSSSYCEYHAYIMEHIFDHRNVLDWCNDLFFGPDAKYQTRHSKKIFNELIKQDIREVYFGVARFLCDWEECQLLLTCNGKGGNATTHTVNMLQDISKEPVQRLENCTTWEGLKPDTPDMEWYIHRYNQKNATYKKWLREPPPALVTRTLF